MAWESAQVPKIGSVIIDGAAMRQLASTCRPYAGKEIGVPRYNAHSPRKKREGKKKGALIRQIGDERASSIVQHEHRACADKSEG